MCILEEDGYLSRPHLNSISTTWNVPQDVGTILGRSHRGNFEFTNDKSYIIGISWG